MRRARITIIVESLNCLCLHPPLKSWPLKHFVVESLDTRLRENKVDCVVFGSRNDSFKIAVET